MSYGQNYGHGNMPIQPNTQMYNHQMRGNSYIPNNMVTPYSNRQMNPAMMMNRGMGGQAGYAGYGGMVKTDQIFLNSKNLFSGAA